MIYTNEAGIPIPDGTTVHTVYVEMKNKHNTMNSSATGKTFIKMQNQLLHDDDCACFLVEAIAKRSQNIKWRPAVDGENMEHRLIRRVSLDQFYALVTGEEDAFYQICMVLPRVIQEVADDAAANIIPHDTVMEELRALASNYDMGSQDLSIAMAIYMLGFSTYAGFAE